MPWPPRQPTRDEIRIEDLAAYADVLSRAWPRQDEDPEAYAGFFGRLLLAPRMAAHLSGLGSAMRTNSNREDSYSHADREWVDQVLTVRLKSNVLQKMHLPDAVAVGVRPEAIAALRAGRDDNLSADERQLTAFIDRVLGGTMTSEVWEGLEARMGERAVVEYAIAVMYIATGIRLYQAVGMPDPTDEEVDDLLAPYLAGTPGPDDWSRRNV